MINSISLNTFANNTRLNCNNKKDCPNQSGNSFNSVLLDAYKDRLVQLSYFKGVTNSQGSSLEVANQLKQLQGGLDEKILKAKDIILRNLNIPPEAVTCENGDCGPGAYAATSLAEGKIYYNKALCQSSNSEFSDNAVLCILRHELDHLVVCAKLYKTLGAEKYEQLMQTEAIKKVLPPDKQKVNHSVFQKLIPYVDTKGFEAQKYIYAIENYNKGVDNTSIEYSNYRKFLMITGNFNNALEESARNAQHELEQKMGVSTLDDFYSMIDSTKEATNLLLAIKDRKHSDKNDFVEIMFDYLYDKSLNELGLQDIPKNWSRIIKNSEKYIPNINDVDVAKAYEQRDCKLKNR